MRQFIFCILLSIPSFSFCQEKKVFTIQPGQKMNEVLKQEDIYKYQKFVAGDIAFKDGTAGRSLLNYNYLFGEMQFIDAKGDTLSIGNTNAINTIQIGSDTFYFDKDY